MRPPVGLIPAAGIGSRLGARGSKELVTTTPEEGSERAWPVAAWLLEAMAAAGIETAYMVLRRGKWDIPDRLAERGDRRPRLGFIVTGGTRSIPESLDLARPFLRGAEVLVGFPDVVFRPTGAAAELLAARRRSSADVTLALFPSDRPDKTDMLEIQGNRVTGFRIKPGLCDLHWTWLLATWGKRFTEFMGAYLERTNGEPPPGSPLPELQISQVMAAALREGLSIDGRKLPAGRFIDVGTREDLARARAERDWQPSTGTSRKEDDDR